MPTRSRKIAPAWAWVGRQGPDIVALGRAELFKELGVAILGAARP